jgi:diketogulonate reductase-like aldo/keto reductase
MEFFTLNDGNKIPAVGFGTFQIPADGSTYKAVKKALELGVRHIDTAAAYFNEAEVGQAVKDNGIRQLLAQELWLPKMFRIIAWLSAYRQRWLRD